MSIETNIVTIKCDNCGLRDIVRAFPQADSLAAHLVVDAGEYCRMGWLRLNTKDYCPACGKKVVRYDD